MRKLIKQTKKILGLKRPHKIIFRMTLKDACADYVGMYKDEILEYHRIRVNASMLGEKGGRSLETLIVHELIHAWQEENNLAEHHGKWFRRMAKILSEEFGMPDLYIKGTDRSKA